MCVLLGDRSAGVCSWPLRIKENHAASRASAPHSCVETFILSGSLCPASAVNLGGKKQIASHHTSELGFIEEHQ